MAVSLLSKGVFHWVVDPLPEAPGCRRSSVVGVWLLGWPCAGRSYKLLRNGPSTATKKRKSSPAPVVY